MKLRLVLWLAWVEEGGEVVQFEQNYLGETIFGQLESASSPYVDLAIPAHPVFEELPSWLSTSGKATIRSDHLLCKSLTENALAVRAPFLGGRTYNAVAEGG